MDCQRKDRSRVPSLVVALLLSSLTCLPSISASLSPNPSATPGMRLVVVLRVPLSFRLPAFCTDRFRVLSAFSLCVCVCASDSRCRTVSRVSNATLMSVTVSFLQNVYFRALEYEILSFRLADTLLLLFPNRAFLFLLLSPHPLSWASFLLFKPLIYDDW